MLLFFCSLNYIRESELLKMQEENNIYFFLCVKKVHTLPHSCYIIYLIIIFLHFLFILKIMCMLQKVKKKNMVVPKMNVYILSYI